MTDENGQSAASTLPVLIGEAGAAPTVAPTVAPTEEVAPTATAEDGAADGGSAETPPAEDGAQPTAPAGRWKHRRPLRKAGARTRRQA
ncbi:MAG: hypothetical protein R2854_18845 [Caldilineaceae bacterium]